MFYYSFCLRYKIIIIDALMIYQLFYLFWFWQNFILCFDYSIHFYLILFCNQWHHDSHKRLIWISNNFPSKIIISEYEYQVSNLKFSYNLNVYIFINLGFIKQELRTSFNLKSFKRWKIEFTRYMIDITPTNKNE